MQITLRRLAALAAVAMAAMAPGIVAADPNPDSYRLGIGDRLSISAFGRADLTGEFTIGGDATVRLPLIGAVPAAGHSRGDVEAAITEKLTRLLGYDVPLTIDIAAYRPIFVIGDVITPGEVLFVPGITALQAYAKAGGAPSLRQMPTHIASQVAVAQRDMRIAQDELNAFLVRRAALDAALQGRGGFALPDELKAVAETPAVAAAVATETALLGAQRQDMEARTALLARERLQLGEEVVALERQIKSLQQQFEVVAEELNRIGDLAEKGLATSQRMLELKRNKAATDSSRYEAAAFLSRAQQDMTQLDLRAHELREELRQRRLEERRNIDGEITHARARAEAATQQLAALGQLNLTELASGTGEITFVVSRNESNGIRTFSAAKATPLHPGDIVQVSVGESRTGNAGLLSRQAALSASTE